MRHLLEVRISKLTKFTIEGKITRHIAERGKLGRTIVRRQTRNIQSLCDRLFSGCCVRCLAGIQDAG